MPPCAAGSLPDRMMLQQLIEFWLRRYVEVAQKWKRTLPFGEYVVDPREKARLLGFGERTSVYDNVVVPGDVAIGAEEQRLPVDG